MLVLPVVRRRGLITIDDDGAADRVCVAAASPRIALRADGCPRFGLTTWVAPADSAAGALPAVGGHLTMDVDLNPRDDDLAVADLGNRTTVPFPWLDALVRLEGPGFDSEQVEVSLAAGSIGALSADLDPTAASVLAQLLESDVVSPLQLTWNGHVRVRLPPVEVSATADVKEIQRRVETTHGANQSIVTRAIIDANARIIIRGAQNPELERALREWVLDELESRFSKDDELVISASAADVVRWPIRLAATVDQLSQLPRCRPLVEKVILEPGEAGTIPPIEVRALGDFDGAVERIDAQLRPVNGDHAVDLVLTDDQPQSVPLETSNFEWRRRLKLVSRPSSDWSPWNLVEGTYGLVIPVVAPTSLELEVLSSGLDFERRWRSVLVAIEHRRPGAPTNTKTTELDASKQSETLSLPLDGLRGAVNARMTFLSRQGRMVEQSIDSVAGDQIIVTDPYGSNRVRVAVVPTGSGWNDVAMAMIDLRYRDGDQTHETTLELRSLTDFVQWEAPASPDGPRGIEWRNHVSRKDGTFEQSAWQDLETTVLTVPLAGVEHREIQILPIHFDPEQTPRLEIELHSGEVSESVSITDSKSRVVNLPPGPFRWNLTWFFRDGSSASVGQEDFDDDVIVLPRAPR
jgi:hypothetical protein